MRFLFTFLVRATAFTGKEVAEVIRQPRLVLTLVVGPFLILLVFGAGYREEAEPRRAVFVAEADNPVRGEIEEFARNLGPQLIYAGTTSEEEEARRSLRAGEVDLVVIVPEDPYGTVRENRHATFVVLHEEINPVQADFIRRLGRIYVEEVNREIRQRVAEEGRERAEDLREEVVAARDVAQALSEALEEGPAADRASDLADDLSFVAGRMTELRDVEPGVIVEPFLTATRSVAPANPSLAHYFAPAVITLLLQHLALTFGGLSLVRDRRMGALELFRVSPISAFETLVGKYLAYLALGGAVTAALTAGMVHGLGVAMLGGWGDYAAVSGGVLFASLGFGFVASLLAQSENQAIQYAMLALLVSVFFSGFLVVLSALAPPVRAISWVIPTTYGIKLLRDVMFRGGLLQPGLLAGLYVMGAALVLLSWILLRRRMATV